MSSGLVSRVAEQRQEVTAKSQLQESCLSLEKPRRRQVGWPEEEDRLTLGGVGVGLPFLSEERSPASWAASSKT